MFAAVAKSIFGSANDRYVRGLGKYVDAINSLEPSIQALSDDELRGQTDAFRQRLANGEKLDDLKRFWEAMAIASRRGTFRRERTESSK